MSKKANPTSIGLFFTTGLALMVVALMLLSSRTLFSPQQKHILYFNTSLKGLSPGAPVKFRGVSVGTVLEVLIRHNQASDDFSMPVIITIDKKATQSKSDEVLQFTKSRLSELIRQGYRGRLDAESIVTGVLYVALEIVPDAPPPVFHQVKQEYEEVPTIPSDVQRLLANLSHLDIRSLSERLSGLVTRLDSTLSQLNMSEINAGVTNFLRSANQLVVTPDITNSLAALRQTLQQAGTLVQRIDDRVDPLAESVTNSLAVAQNALAAVQIGVRNVASLLGPDSAFRSDLIEALEELTNAGRSVADFAEFLQFNPNALLTGRKRPKAQP